ncbi:MAG: M1 family metallopeptidase [Actinomycetota bacterium]
MTAARSTDRLPDAVRPSRYDLVIRPDLDTATFTGSVRIACAAVAPVTEIVLHAREIDVTLTGVEVGGATVAATLTADPATERLVIALGAAAGPGPLVVELAFAGAISPGMLGFYRSTFTGPDGTPQVLGATQFEAPHARAAFPCFDEPEFKAVFAVTLEVAEGLLALANGPETDREALGDGRVRVRFADTIPMSTYLVAWVVGPLEITDPVDAGGVAVRVAHVPGKGHLTAFALDLAAFTIPFFADYYGIPHPGPKCDLVALPDFSFGAMENLGCVTFRETRLLVDPEQATLDEMAAAALTIVHEIAHMWFGDLVTMKWWNGIWLNEAFATFMEHVGVDAYRPDWRPWDDFATGRAAAFDVDALASTRTVEYEVHTPADADGMFDVLTYQKGGSVLRMLERWLGPERFRDGVRTYLDRHRLGNTETTDLWDAIEAETGEPVRRIMGSWIDQPGFPVVRRADDTLRQARFTYSPGTEPVTYAVPVVARVHHDGTTETRRVLLGAEPAPFAVPADALVVLDDGGEGFFRVGATVTERTRLLDAGVLAPLERYKLIDDCWAEVLAGTSTAADLLACAERLTDERELVVWRGLVAHLRGAGRLVVGPALDAYRARVATIAGPAFARLGFVPAADDDDRTRQLRGLVISLLGAFAQEPTVVARAHELVAAGTPGDADVAAAAVGIVAHTGGPAEFDTFVARAGDPTNPQEQLRYLYALGDFPDAALVERACALALSDLARPQNAPFLGQRALRNRDHATVAWAFVRDRWADLHDRMGGALVARMLDGVTWIVEDDAVAAEIAGFLAGHPIPEAARTIDQIVERLAVHRAAVGRERERFAAHLLGA